MTSLTPRAAAETNPMPIVFPGPEPVPGAGTAVSGSPVSRRQTRERGGPMVRDNRRDDARPAVARAVAATPLAGCFALMVLFAIHKPWLYLVLREDYPVEWAQFSLCLFAAIMSFAAAVHFARRGQPLTAVLMVLVGLGLVGLAGEEISWGQRVFGLAEPTDLARVNHQDELNVHDTYVAGIAVDEVFEVFEFMLGLVGVALALLTRGRRPVLTGRFWWHLSPPLFTVPGFLAMALYRPLVLVMPASVAAPVTIFQEWVEFCLYGAIAVTVVCAYRRALPGRSQPDHAPRPRWFLAPGPGSTRPVTAVAAFVVLLTVLFAVMTIAHGMVPGNVTYPGGS